MKYNFVEIGTCDFQSLIQTASDSDLGISVEPIAHYLDRLPSKPRVKKLNLAISPSNQLETLLMYYVPELEIQRHCLPDWLRGCNSLGGYHFQHTALNITHLVQTQEVRSVPIAVLFRENQVTELEYLKLDTEGSDSDILVHFYDYLTSDGYSKPPVQIEFETNSLTPEHRVQEVLDLYAGLGYRVVQRGHETVISLGN